MVKTPLGASASEINAVNLTRMISRLQKLLNNPDSETENRLLTDPYEREKVGKNIEHARSLLLQLEQDAQNIRVQTKKQEVQMDLIRKRDLLNNLAGTLQDLSLLGQNQTADDSSEEEADKAEDDTPDDATDEQDPTPPATASSISTEHIPSPTSSSPSSSPYRQPYVEDEQLPELRNRNVNRQERQEREELFAAAPTAQSTGISTATTETLLSHNRIEQEDLTTSMLNMAAQLKQQSRAFAASLEGEKEILNRAAGGLDKNELGMEAAQRKMGFLRGYTEGKGWWGRMIMYAWIFALMVLALVIVFVLPKLRF